ncbi:MAG: efflux transporter outer membrane subunit [Sphingomonadales bacterium]|nr:MAG: efflux transporter outer membrane subunit [Sphingomonadales bacterium]TNF04919.1 MAG: efflux transporter outer membrane subunit [Sphingomonadales bacterium]
MFLRDRHDRRAPFQTTGFTPAARLFFSLTHLVHKTILSSTILLTQSRKQRKENRTKEYDSVRRYLFALLLASLSACAPGASERGQLRSLSSLSTERSLAGNEDIWPGDGWWADYGDPQLTQLIEEAKTGSPDMMAAMARLRRADAFAREAGAALLPEFSVTADGNFKKQSYNNGIPPAFVPHGWNDTGQISASGSFDPDLWGRNRAALAAATSQARAAAVDRDQALLLLSSGIATAYADIARLFAERDIADRAVKVREETFDLTGKRVIEGLDNRGTLQLAESKAASARAERAALDEAIALSRNRIAALVGAGPDRGLAITRPDIKGLAPHGLPRDIALNLLGRRPDILSARLRTEAAAATIGSARAAFYPNINITALFGIQSLGLSNLVDSGSTFGSVGPALSLPLFNRGRLVGQLRRSEADFDLAVADYDTTLIAALREVADAAASIRALEQRRHDIDAALSAAEGAYDIARQRYRGGLATYLDVLASEDSLLAARRDAADIRARAFTLDIALVRALGGGFIASSSSRASVASQGDHHG